MLKENESQTAGNQSIDAGVPLHAEPAGNPETAAPAGGRHVRYLRHANQVAGLTDREAAILDEVSERYAFRANDYYLGLIDWNDPDDPIRRIVIPREEELVEFGRLDASMEAANTVVQGVQHKYGDTALVLVNSMCASYCRYCFRKRLFMDGNDETVHELEPAFAYIGAHPEVTDVLLTGGDPLIMSTAKLRGIVERLATISHVRTIRIGSKVPAFNPFRILDDPSLIQMFRDFSSDQRAIYLMAHFDHPRELTREARAGLILARENGARVVNQCPIIRGINDDPEVLATLFREMTLLGAPQYYLFQCRPTAGNAAFEMPLVRAWSIFNEAQRRSSGLSRRARFAMSDASGKIEVLGIDDAHIYLRYHRAKHAEDHGRMLVCHRDDNAFWFDQLRVVGSPEPSVRRGDADRVNVMATA